MSLSSVRDSVARCRELEEFDVIAPFRRLRRRILAGGAAAARSGALAGFRRVASTAEEPLITRPIPHTGELIPVVGIGTAVTFDFQDDQPKVAERRHVLQTLLVPGRIS